MTATPTDPPPTTSLTPIAEATPQTGGTINLGLVGQPNSLNPIIETNAALHQMTPLLFDTLLRVDPNTAQLQPGLALSWSYSQTGHRVTFTLPPDLKWSDGSPLTASDVIESLEATRHPALLAFSRLTAPNDQMLLLSFTAIDCSAVTALAQLPLLPADQILERTPTGSGPFLVNTRDDTQQTLTLIPNPHYHGNAPLLDRINVRFFDSAAARIALSEGAFDVFGPFPAATTNPNPTELSDLVYPAPQVIYVAMNFDPRNELPVSPQVRRALQLALDRPAILAEALRDDGQLMAGSLLPTHWAANADIAPPAYDPEAARTLLAEAGLRDTDWDGWLDQDGQRLELAMRVNGQSELHQNLGWLITSYYRELGLYVRPESSSLDSIIDDLFTHDFELALYSWLIPPDPDQRRYWHSTENDEGEGLNFTSYQNLALDDLLDKGIATAGCPFETRAKTYTQIQETLNRERPVDFLLTPNQHVFVSQQLAGLEPGPFVPFTWNAPQWYLKNQAEPSEQ